MAARRRSPRLHARSDDISQRISSGISKRFGDQKQDCAEGNQWPERVKSAVHAVESRQSRESEEGGSATPIAGKGEAILSSGQLTVGRIKVGSRAGSFCGQ